MAGGACPAHLLPLLPQSSRGVLTQGSLRAGGLHTEIPRALSTLLPTLRPVTFCPNHACRAEHGAPFAAPRRPTQIRSCARTTFPFRHARCSAVRPSPSPQVSFTSSREPWASSRMTARRSSSAVARSRCWPRDSSVQGSGARKSFCSYLARIHRSFSSLQEPPHGCGHCQEGQPRLKCLSAPAPRWSGGLRVEVQ